MKEDRFRNNIIDYVKLVSCIMIIGSHCLPLFSLEFLNYYYGQWFFRFCVPLFFISTGYFFSKMDIHKRWKYILRIMVIFGLSTLLYLPLFINGSLRQVISRIVFGYHHLWYLSALLFGLILFQLLDKVIPRGKSLCILTLWGGGTARRVFPVV